MERSSILRWLLIGVVVWLAYTYGGKYLGIGPNSDTSVTTQPLGPESTCSADAPCAPESRLAAGICDVQGKRFKAQFTTQGASLLHLWLDGAQYKELDGSPIDLVTTPGHEQRRPLRFDLRTSPANAKDTAQVAYDAFDWKLEKSDGKSCTFTYVDQTVELTRTIRASERPFELEVQSTVKNLAQAKRTHKVSVEVDAWRYNKEVESKLGRQSPFISDVSCSQNGKSKKMMNTDFEPSDFKDAGFENGWFVQRGNVEYAATSNFYFSQAIVAQEPQATSCSLQIEDRPGGDIGGAFYRARLGFEARDLNPGESASYNILTFLGPKERDVLATAAGGTHHLSDLVDLGFFSPIAKYLLKFLVWLHGVTGNWGIAIILMTISVRTLLFPLTMKSIQSGFAMRKLKPEIDALNIKYKDDAQQKGLATMELYKQNKVNPVGGCLPAVFQLPIWWALYTSLQTAVELYHTPFAWFRDLSAPDPYYILPIVLGGTMIIQQRMMPQQLDPAQQKMMTYVMPLVFTVMMLFLPAGLGVYMLTNAILGILQQLGIEKYWSSKAPIAATASGISVREK